MGTKEHKKINLCNCLTGEIIEDTLRAPANSILYQAMEALAREGELLEQTFGKDDKGPYVRYKFRKEHILNYRN